MDRRLTSISDSVATDTTMGASQLTMMALDRLLSLSDEELGSVPAAEWIEFCMALHRAKPTVAPLFNLANTILLGLERGAGGGELRRPLAAMLERESGSAARIYELAKDEIEGGWLMTCSYSGTVKRILLDLARDRELRVTVAESLPGGEGRTFARELAEAGIESEVVPDSTVIARMAVVDTVLVGADSVTAHGLVNKVGTRMLVEGAAFKEMPSLALCGWSKVSPVVLSEPVVSAKNLGPRLSEHIQVYESTPLELLTHIITDRGGFSPADLKMELKMEKVAPAWYAQGVLRKP